MKIKSIQKEDIIIINLNVLNNIVDIFVTELKANFDRSKKRDGQINNPSRGFFTYVPEQMEI